MNFRMAHPENALRGFVRSYGLRQGALASGPRRLVFPARTDQMLEFYLGDAPKVVTSSGGQPKEVPSSVLIGTQALGRVELFLSGLIRTFTISFTPTGFSQLFGITMSDFAGNGVDARGVLGLGIQDLRERLGNESEFEGMVAHANQFLVPLVQRCKATPDRFFHLLQFSNLEKFNHVESVDNWVSATGLSVRQFERRFNCAVGVSPKRYLRVRRFQRALKMKDSVDRLTWGQVAAECGYYDQMHLVREFKDLGGEAPSTLFCEVRQRLEFA